MLRHDLLYKGKPHAKPEFLCAEKGVKDPSNEVFRDAGTGIRNQQPGTITFNICV